VATFTVRRVPGAYGRPVSGLGGGGGATATAGAAPVWVAKLTAAPWREQGLARIAEQRFVLACIQDDPAARRIPAGALDTIQAHWDAAEGAATKPSRRGASVARVSSHLDAVDTSLLRLSPASFVYGQLPGLLARMRPERGKATLVVLLGIASVTLMSIGPRILGRATDLVFNGFIGSMFLAIGTGMIVICSRVAKFFAQPDMAAGPAGGPRGAIRA